MRRTVLAATPRRDPERCAAARRPGLVRKLTATLAPAAILALVALLLPAHAQGTAQGATQEATLETAPARPERWRPLSASATNLTGTVRFAATRLEFGNGAALPLTEPKPLPGFTTAGGPVEAVLYRVAAPANPALLRRATLCGLRQKARYVAVWTPPAAPGGPERGLAVFSGRAEPKGDDAPGLCGTFSYVLGRNS